MSTDPPAARATLHGKELGGALRALRVGAGLSGRAFIESLAAASGPQLDPPKLSRIESGERGLPVSAWHRLIHAAHTIGLPSHLVHALASLLPQPDSLIEPLPPGSVADTLERWYAVAATLAARPTPRVATASDDQATRGLAAAAFVARFRPAVDAILRRAELKAMPTVAARGDDVRVLTVSPAETRVGPNQPFEIQLRLRNAGTVEWAEDRLLLRLGPPITSTLAQTAPLLPVPPTQPGGACDIVVPGRGHYLPGRCVVTYVMVFANGQPCVPGGLSIPITTVAELHSTLTLAHQVAALFRRRRT